MLISLAEYAKNHGKSSNTVRHKASTGGLKTAIKIGRNWCIDSEEPYLDGRITNGDCRNWRKSKTVGSGSAGESE